MSKKTILAISGSQRSKSFTEKMLDLCLEGMGESIEFKKFYPHKMNIGPCPSYWDCWCEEAPEVCAQKDDFQEILDVYERADYFLLAFPLYYFSFPATVKNVIDRLLITLNSSQFPSARVTTEHPNRHPKTVIISSCGFPEIENFDIVRQHFKKICDESDWHWAGEILISASAAAKVPKLFDEKYKLIKKAGRDLVDGVISKAMSDAISAPVMEAKDYREMCNARFSGPGEI